MTTINDLYWMVVLTGIMMVVMAFMIGANDMANVLGSSVGSKAISLPMASIIAGIFVTIGSVGLGGTVSKAIRDEILDLSYFEDKPEVLMMGMFAALIGASIWLIFATYFEMPVSTTHSIVGAIIGMGIATGGAAVNWGEVGMIVLSWIAAPVLAGVIAALIYFIIRAAILRSSNSTLYSYRFLWLLLWFTNETFMLFFLLQTKLALPVDCLVEGEMVNPCVMEDWFLSNPGFGILAATGAAIVLTFLFAIPVYMFAKKVMKDAEKSDLEVLPLSQSSVKAEKVAPAAMNDDSNEGTEDVEVAVEDDVEEKPKTTQKPKINIPVFWNVHETSFKDSVKAIEMRENVETFPYKTEKVFTVLQVISASFDSVALGASDIANAVAPFSTILGIYEAGGVAADYEVPYYLLFGGGLAIALGVALAGFYVIKTLGVKLVAITPTRGFCIEMGSAIVVLLFSYAGVPLSTTHCQVGATIGAGLLETRKSGKFGQGVNWILFAVIFGGWIGTLVVAGLISAAVYGIGFALM